MDAIRLHHAVCKSIDANAAAYTAASDAIWDHPEVNFHEDFAAERLIFMLEENGFAVTKNLAGLPNAFRAEYGSGKPVIAYLGEYDALSSLSQKAGCASKDALVPGAPGHGCGHNLLGVGALAAAIAIKEMIAAGELSGTVVYFGCPAEETGSAKAFMARDHVFDGVDAMLTWHPWDYNGIWPGGSLANVKMIFRFKGQSAHAASCPELGRSALDALELMNVGVQFLREHNPSSSRIHYAITDAGGMSPNVVQGHAEVLYLIRGVDNQIVKELYDRVNDIAKGAALMTGTKESHVFIKACSNCVVNESMQRMLQEKMDQITPPKPTEEEEAFARKMTLDALGHVPAADPDHPIWWEVLPYQPEKQEFGSTDVGDASWVCPTAQFVAACEARGTPGHSWQETAQVNTSYAHRMTRYAAKILAAGAVELLRDEELLKRAKEEHRRRVGPKGYEPPIPKDVRPRPLNSFKK